jgi:hypothetical protein
MKLSKSEQNDSTFSSSHPQKMSLKKSESPYLNQYRTTTELKSKPLSIDTVKTPSDILKKSRLEAMLKKRGVRKPRQTRWVKMLCQKEESPHYGRVFEVLVDENDQRIERTGAPNFRWRIEELDDLEETENEDYSVLTLRGEELVNTRNYYNVFESQEPSTEDLC